MKEITMQEFLKLAPKAIQLVDVREPDEYNNFHIEGAVLIPKGELVERKGELDNSKTLYLICRTGMRSMFMSQVMEVHGFDTINVLGGVEEYLKLTNSKGN